MDIVSEDAILTWAMEMEGADESDKKFVNRAEEFITVCIQSLEALKFSAMDRDYII